MEILEFVKVDEIDPLYFDASYYVTPEDEGRKAYQLLLDAMGESEYAAIAKLTMHQREHIVVIRPREKGMTLHTMFYTNEIREVAEYGKIGRRLRTRSQPRKSSPSSSSKASPRRSNPKSIRTDMRKAWSAMIEAKRQGQEIATRRIRSSLPSST